MFVVSVYTPNQSSTHKYTKNWLYCKCWLWWYVTLNQYTTYNILKIDSAANDSFFLKHQLTPLVEWNGNLREGGIAAEWYSCWKMSIFEKKSFEEGIKFLEYWYFNVDADANVDPDVEISMLRWLRSSPKN